MVKKIDLCIITIVFTVLISFVTIPVVADSTPPASVSNLHMISRGANYIDWGWTDPTTSDFNRVVVYINGVFKANVPKGTKHYNASSLTSGTTYTIGTHTVDNSGNINPVWKNNTQTTSGGTSGLGTIRFVTIGDPHITSNTSKDQYIRFTKAINYINNRTDVDFVVIMGDLVDTASTANFATANSSLHKLKKRYYVVEGNHDIGTIPGANFRTYIGPTEHVENIGGYQLIFVGINRNGTKDINGATIRYDWLFDFSSAYKNKPTIIFSHGPVQPKPGGKCSNWDANANKEVYFSYACSMKSETDKFTNLLGYYAGHVHTNTSQKIGNTLYVTSDNIGGNGADSDYIGYTIIQNGNVVYGIVRY